MEAFKLSTVLSVLWSDMRAQKLTQPPSMALTKPLVRPGERLLPPRTDQSDPQQLTASGANLSGPPFITASHESTGGS